MQFNESNRALFLYPFLAMSLISLLFMIGLGLMLESWLFERNGQELRRIADVTERRIIASQAKAEDMDKVADNVGLATSNMRVSILDNGGRIKGDSYYAPTKYSTLPSQLKFPEVVAALKNGKGLQIRHSELLNAQAVSYAQRFEHNGGLGVIRVSMPLKEVNDAIINLRWLLLLAYLFGLVFLVLLFGTFARKLKQTMLSERRLLEKRVEERTAEIDMLQRLASMLAACNSVAEVQQVASDIVPKIIGELPCAVSQINDKGSLLEQSMAWGGLWPGMAVFGTDECWALRKGRHHISKDNHSSLTCHHMGEVQDKTLCVPLLAHGHAIGLLHVLLGEDSDQIHLNIVFTIAEHLGLALANLSMQAKLKDQAIKDPLTKIYNRRFMDETLEKELNRSERHDKAFSMLLLDIDLFKPFNDNFGHDAGDYVLQRLAQLLKEGVRKEDIPCRIGGEEFAVLLPETGVDEAKLCANKINQMVRDEELFFNGLPLGKLTVSIGIATFKQHGDNPMALYKSADVALYEAKSAGRDQAKVASTADVYKVLDINLGKSST